MNVLRSVYDAIKSNEEIQWIECANKNNNYQQMLSICLDKQKCVSIIDKAGEWSCARVYLFVRGRLVNAYNFLPLHLFRPATGNEYLSIVVA